MAGVAARCRLEALLLNAQPGEVIGQIAAGLVHDFNNMLTGVLGNAAIVRERVPESHRAALPLQRIDEAARGAALLARELLDFVWGSMEREVISVNELAAVTRQAMWRALRDGVAVEVDLAPDVPAIEGERPLIRQALVNLVLNAAEAITGEGNVTIRTRCVEVLPPDAAGQARPSASYIPLSVTDTGSGIAPEHRSELFRPFFTTKGSAGTGLGLAAVSRIVQRHGGAVGVESRPGAGSTFTIYLPAAPFAPGPVGAPRARPLARAGRRA